MAKKLTKFEIAVAIERLPGNIPWSANSNMTIMCDVFTRQELVERYNSLISDRGLNLQFIS